LIASALLGLGDMERFVNGNTYSTLHQMMFGPDIL
jgi:hypothetical protein